MLTASPQKPAATPVLLDVQQVSELLNCSKRHVTRLADAGRLPPPLRLGSLCRWRADELHAWLAAGAPAVRTLGARP